MLSTYHEGLVLLDRADVWSVAFTRTLTTLYSMTLLSLFTHVQLNILGRSKYVQSVVQQAQEEAMRETLQDTLSFVNIFLGGSSPGDIESADGIREVESISERTEKKYFTLSWWMLNVGWKDVGERVRRGVEEVFEGYAQCRRPKFGVPLLTITPAIGYRSRQSYQRVIFIDW